MGTIGNRAGPRPRYEVLDALRGLCAFAVVALHICEAHGEGRLIPHSHMAVEYFFALTGFTFVIAYEPRWKAGTLTVASFLWRRFLRLWPLVLIGSFVGLMLCFGMPGRFYGRTPPDVLGQIGHFLYSLTMLPQSPEKGMITSMQPQTWTLLYIIWANLLYAFVLRRLNRIGVALALVLGAGYSIWATSVYHVLAYGWMWTAPHIIAATARLAFPLFLGMCIAQHGWRLSFRGAGLAAAILLGGMLFAPIDFGRVATGWYELGLLFIVLPLVLLLGTGGAIPEGRFAAFCRFMGAYSFPLYATHYPFTTLLRNWLADHPALPVSVHAAGIVAFLVAIFATAYLAMKGADRVTGVLRKLVPMKGLS